MNAWLDAPENRTGLFMVMHATIWLLGSVVFAALAGWWALLPLPFLLFAAFSAGRACYQEGVTNGLRKAQDVVRDTMAGR